MINKDIVVGKWKELKGKLLERWSDLTDDELGKIQHSWGELEGIIQQRYGRDRERARKEVKEFEKNMNDVLH